MGVETGVNVEEPPDGETTTELALIAGWDVGGSLPPLTEVFSKPLVFDGGISSSSIFKMPKIIPDTNSDPELIVSEIVPVEGKEELILSKHTAACGLNNPDSKKVLTWVIGTNHPSRIEELDEMAKSLVSTSFSEVTIATDRGLRKASWFGKLLHAHVSRFEIDPEDPIKVKRQIVEMLVGDKAILTIDHSGDSQTLLALRQAVIDKLVPSFQLSSVGALANRTIEHILAGNSKVLDRLDLKLEEWESKVKDAPLNKLTIKDLNELRETLLFFKRKSEQTSEVLIALKQASSEFKHLFNGHSSDNILHGGEQSLRSVLGRVTDMIERVDSLADAHDRQRKVRSDKLMGNFTILVGISVPPIVTEIVCRNCLESIHKYHPFIIAGAVLLSLGMAAYAKLTDWNFKPAS